MNELTLPAADRDVEGFGGRVADLPSLRYAVGVLQSKWRLGAAVAGAVFAAVVGLGLLIPHGYYCQALLVFNPTSDDLVQPASAQSSLPPDTSAIDTEVEVLRSPAVAAAVVRKFKLYRDPEFGGSDNAQPTEEAMRRAVSALQSASRIRRVGLTYAVQVGFVASSIDKARTVANGIVDAYIARKLDEKLAAVTRANRDLGATLGGLRRQALEAESQVERYKAANNLLGASGSASTEEELAALDRQVLDARAETAEKLARAAAAEAQARSGAGGTDAGAVLASGTIGALRQKEAQASANLSQLETEFRPDYPLVEKANAELQEIRAQIRSETRRIVAGLKAEATVAARKESSLLASREQTEQRLSADNRARVGLLTLQQSADTAKKIYETYLTRASEAAVARSLQRVDATVESRAVPAASSIFSSLRFKLALGAIMALLSAIAAILFSEGWVRKIRSRSDVIHSAGLPVAGVLPDIVTLENASSPANHLARHPLTAFAESFRVAVVAFEAVTVFAGARSVGTAARTGAGSVRTIPCAALTVGRMAKPVSMRLSCRFLPCEVLYAFCRTLRREP